MKRLKIFMFIIILLLIYLYFGNNFIVKSRYEMISNKISKDYKIIQISDNHSKKFIFNNFQLLNIIKKENPDMIVWTGDTASKQYPIENTYFLAKQLKDICGNVYFIQGNHDINKKEINYDELKENLMNIGIKILENENINYNEEITIHGINIGQKEVEEYNKNILDESKFNILLIHKFKDFANNKLKFDIALMGHEHGNQVRIPFIGGLYSPDYGLLPGKLYGYKIINNVYTIINRGLGGYRFIPRINNNPEIVIIDVKKQ